MVEIMSGYWSVRTGTIKEFAPDIQADYHGDSVAKVIGGQEWKRLQVKIHVPVATTHQNGTALQLRVTPKQYEGKDYGATLWVDDVVIRAIRTNSNQLEHTG